MYMYMYLCFICVGYIYKLLIPGINLLHNDVCLLLLTVTFVHTLSDLNAILT